MELYFVRHIKPDFEEGTCYGQTNVPIKNNYIEEHKKIIQELPNDFDAVCTSPLTRCTLLAEQLSKNCISDSRLMELNFGDWEGKKWDDINQHELNKWMENYIALAPPKGESLVDLSERLSSFICQIKVLPHKKVIVVTHAGIIRCAMNLFNKVPIEQIMMEKVEFGGIYKFDNK